MAPTARPGSDAPSDRSISLSLATEAWLTKSSHTVTHWGSTCTTIAGRTTADRILGSCRRRLIAHCFNVEAKTFSGVASRCVERPRAVFSRTRSWTARSPSASSRCHREPGLGPLSTIGRSAPCDGASPDFGPIPAAPTIHREMPWACRWSLRSRTPDDDQSAHSLRLSDRPQFTASTDRQSQCGVRVNIFLSIHSRRGLIGTYWDLVSEQRIGSRALHRVCRRTDAPGSRTHRMVQALLEYLPSHPIARRLRLLTPCHQRSGLSRARDWAGSDASLPDRDSAAVVRASV